MKKMYSIILLSLVYSSLFAIESKTDTVAESIAPNYFGVNIGGTTGIGLSYIYFKNNNGFQITFLPLIDKKNTYLSCGFTYLHIIKELNKTSFYLYWGNHLTNFFSDEYSLHIGVGPGIQYQMYDFYINFMIGYAVFGITGNTMVRPTGELGVFYNF
jgi:hypothetical protein